VKLLAFSILSVSLFRAQKREEALRVSGKVQQVDTGAKRLTVANEPIEGWMGADDDGLCVDNEDALQRVKPGDRSPPQSTRAISTLHGVQVIPPQMPAGFGLRTWSRWRWRITRQSHVPGQSARGRGMARQAGLYPIHSRLLWAMKSAVLHRGGKQGGFVKPDDCARRQASRGAPCSGTRGRRVGTSGANPALRCRTT